MSLYVSYGFTRIPPFGPYLTEPTSVCYSKRVLVNRVVLVLVVVLVLQWALVFRL